MPVTAPDCPQESMNLYDANDPDPKAGLFRPVIVTSSSSIQPAYFALKNK